jgi:protein TIF31
VRPWLWLQEALKLSQKLLGDEHVQTAVCLHTLALVFDAMGNYKLAIRHETSTYNILKKVLGEDEQRVVDSATFLRQFKQKDAEVRAGEMEEEGD